MNDLADLIDEYQKRQLESDSTIASCNCLAKSPDIKYHKIGCKYRILGERNAAREEVKEARSIISKLLEGMLITDPRWKLASNWLFNKRYGSDF